MSIVPAVDYPKLRPLDIRPQAHNGQVYYLLRDPAQLSESSLLVPPALAAALSFCDGTRTIEGVSAAFSLHFGASISTDLIRQLIQAMDEAYLLDNERSGEAYHRAIDAYRQAPFRPPLLAGQGYPDSPDALTTYLDDYLRKAAPSDDASSEVSSEASAELIPAVIDGRFGLLSPHIDYTRGGAVYAQVWRYAAEAVRAADLVILFGTDHYGSDPFTLTTQHYATPFGVLPTDQNAVQALVDALGDEAAFAGELRHRGEHSLEMIAVWLHHMRQGKACNLVPILVGSFHHFIQNGAAPAGDSQINQVISVLQQAMSGRRVAVIASGDMAHVGPAFGGAPLDKITRASVRTADEDLMANMCNGDAEGFFASIHRQQDRYNVCGVSPIYLTLRLLGDVHGQQFGYASCAADAQDTSAVTICGMVFR